MKLLVILILEHIVALRKESVDRNKYVVQCRKTLGVVALRKESVDRNRLCNWPVVILPPSLSARRAWIEMLNLYFKGADFCVALRKESVDRNFHVGNSTAALPRSLSARRAWIEMHDVSLNYKEVL